MKQTIHLILIFNLICLIGLVAGLRWWQKKHGKLTEKRIALIMTGYWSFFALTTFSPLLITHPREAILVEIVLLLVCWGIGYPWTRWLYRQFNSSK